MSITRRVTAWLASSRGLFLSAVLAGSLCGVGFLGIGESAHTMTARFTDADGLVVGNEVRVAGVQAGTVQAIKIAVDPSNGLQYAEVDMQIDPSHWPLHQGTFVAVKPKGVLSNVFVQLDPGPAQNASLGNHPFFNFDQTQSPVNLDELSNVFTPDVRNSIRTQLQQGVLAFGGAGATDLNQTIYHANPLTLDAIPVTDVLATRSPQLDALNYEFDKVSGDLAREDANLRPLIVNLNTTLNALAVREVELQGTLVHAANVFGDLSQALSSPATQDALARIFREGPQALSCASALTTNLSPLVAAVNPYIKYNAPRSLDWLLGEFVTATGFNNGTSGGVDALRIDPTLPPNGYSSSPAGGLTANHHGYHNYGGLYEEMPPLPVSTMPVLGGCPPSAGLHG
jgi:ABC-type transporter Mla subunit MlaD